MQRFYGDLLGSTPNFLFLPLPFYPMYSGIQSTDELIVLSFLQNAIIIHDHHARLLLPLLLLMIVSAC